MSTARAVLAVTASGFAVVGLADVVLRLICDCVQCYWTCRSASELIPNLLRGLLSLNNIVTNVRIFLDDYSRSLFAQQSLLRAHCGDQCPNVPGPSEQAG